jgi:Phosphotransferase enzyme family
MSINVERRDQHAPMTVPAGLQPFGALPAWLEAAAQPERVQRALARTIPACAAGELTLEACEIKRLLLKAKTRCWTGSYRVTVAGPQPEQRRVIVLRGTILPPGMDEPAAAGAATTFGEPGWRTYLPELRLELQVEPEETELTMLPSLTDPEQARALLEESIRRGPGAYSEIRIAAAAPRVARHKPNSRCTILYHLEYPADLAAARHWPDLVVAKVYHDDKGQNAYTGMRALWESPLATSSAVSIAEPLAYLPELKLLLQGPIREEQTLSALLRGALRSGTPEDMAAAQDYLRKTAVGLAELHHSGVRYGAPWGWADELADTRKQLERLARAVPHLADARTILAAPLLERLETLARAYPVDPPVPTHGTFRPAQVLLYQGRIGFIDFDSFCQAEPAMDLALFRSSLKDKGMRMLCDEGNGRDAALDPATCRARVAQLEELGEVFLAHYERHAPVSRQRVALWEARELFTLLLRCWARVQPIRMAHMLMLLEHHGRATGLWCA